MDFISTFKVTKEAGSQVKIEGEIPFDEVLKHRDKAIAHIGKDMDIPGFRKGNIPPKMIEAQVGPMAILSEMAERALALAYPLALKEHKIDAIGYPQITLTKIAEGNPLGFTATVAVLPEVKLPDFKKIASTENKAKPSEEVTEAEVDQQIKDILRQKLAYERLQGKAQQTHTHEDGTVHEGPSHGDGVHEGEEDHTEDVHTEPEVKGVQDSELPALTDEYVATLGQPDQFKTVVDFKAKIKEHLAVEKANGVKAAHRAKITDKIIEETKMELPQILIDSEIEQMFGQMNEDLERAHLKMDDYLGHIKKTKDELKTEWTPAAEKRAKLQLVLNEIAKKENVTPDKVQLDAQVDQLMAQYKDADQTRVRVYVNSVMTNEAVMQMLEQA
jgi:trigger factor